LLLLGWPALLWAAPPVSLDEVFCAVCHFEQGDQFSESLHYQSGQLLCNDCHGGLPFEADAKKAKAPGTGFVGRPGRPEIASLCGRCHTGPAAAFARGPHAAWQKGNNPTCVTCHHNHRVVDADLMLMDSACGECHPDGSPALAQGHQLRQALEEVWWEYHRVQTRLDSLRPQDRSLGRAAPYMEAALIALREADPETHSLELAPIRETAAEARRELEQAQEFIDARAASQARRRWIALGVWVFVGANVLLLWLKRRQMQ